MRIIEGLPVSPSIFASHHHVKLRQANDDGGNHNQEASDSSQRLRSSNQLLIAAIRNHFFAPTTWISHRKLQMEARVCALMAAGAKGKTPLAIGKS